MMATPAPSVEETRANRAFDALLWALSRPGLARTLPDAGESAVIGALLDRECRVHAADPLLMPDIMRTGAELADIAAADHVFLGAMADVTSLEAVATGSDLYPDAGATVIVRCRIGEGADVCLSGPGVDGSLTVQIAGLPGGFWAARAARLRYPTGFDLFLVDGQTVLGIPRSTEVKEL